MRLVQTALVALLAAGPAAAVTVKPLTDFGDLDFQDVCRGGVDAFAEDCERAVAEIRAGKPGGSGFEYTARNPFETRGFSGPNGQLDINGAIARDGRAEFALRITHDGLVGPDGKSGFVFSVDGAALSEVRVDFDPVESIVIRMRNKDGSFSLSDLVLGGRSVGIGGKPVLLGEGPAGPGQTLVRAAGPDVGYLAIGGFDFGAAFTLTATATFTTPITTSGPAKNSDSNLAAQFKLVDVDLAPVPLPASALMLLAGLGALGAARRAR